MVKITRLTIKGVGVGKGPMEMSNQVGEIVASADGVIRTGFDFINRIFLGVGIQIAHDDEVGVAATGWIGGKPVYQGFCGGAAGLATIALTVAQIRVADIITG